MKRSLSHRLEKGDLLPALLILPALLLVFCIIIIPMCYGLIVSLFDYNLGDTLSAENFVGLGNYIRAFQDRTVWKALLNTLLFAVGCIAGDLFFGTVIAILLYRLRESVSRILRPFVIMPLLVAPVVASLMWSYFFDANELSTGCWNLSASPMLTFRHLRHGHGAAVLHHRPLVAERALRGHRADGRTAVHLKRSI